jgi:hypothetical protein
LKRINWFFALLAILILALVIPIAVLAGMESIGGEKGPAQTVVKLNKNEVTASNNKHDLSNSWTLKLQVLIEDKNAIYTGLSQANARLIQLEQDYEKALSSGNTEEKDFLAGCIETEKSNITAMNIILKNTIEEIKKIRALAQNATDC